MNEGLRARSRLKRRTALERAALQLFAEKGYESTTLAHIADAAEVSVRTLMLYYPTKLDLALSYASAAAERLTAACSQRVSGESVMEAISRWITEEFHAHQDFAVLHAAMIQTNPALRGSETTSITASRLAVTREFAKELGHSPNTPIVMLAAGALIGVLSALFDTATTNAGIDNALDAAKRLVAAIIAEASRPA